MIPFEVRKNTERSCTSEPNPGCSRWAATNKYSALPENESDTSISCTSSQNPVTDVQLNRTPVQLPRDEQGSKIHVSPFDVAPIPVIKKRTSNRGRKPCKSQVITSSPYKNDLEQSLSTPKKPPPKRKLFPNPRREASKKQKKCDDSDSDQDSNAESEPFVPADEDIDIDDVGQIVPDDKDATCLFCDGRFSEDRRGELWVCCLMCNMWAHDLCSGAEKDNYVCDFCK